MNLGSFKTERDAALAYDKAARELHGEFANCNFAADDDKRVIVRRMRMTMAEKRWK